jgi:hypothetical protein
MAQVLTTRLELRTAILQRAAEQETLGALRLSDAAVNAAINRAIAAGWPELYETRVQQMLDERGDKFWYDLPIPFVAVDQVYIGQKGGAGVLQLLERSRWQISGHAGAQKIYFTERVPTEPMFRIVGRLRLPSLDADGDGTEAPPGFVIAWALYDLCLREVERTPEEAERYATLSNLYLGEANALLGRGT